MASPTKRLLENRARRKAYPEQAIRTRNASTVNVRSKVEQQFTLMEQAHDRIRTQELAARLRERTQNDPRNHRNVFF